MGDVLVVKLAIVVQAMRDVFSYRRVLRWFIGVEVEQETSAPPPKKNPGSKRRVHPLLKKILDPPL